MKWILTAVCVMFIWVVVLALCKAASEADRQDERMWERHEAEKDR